MKLDVYSHSFMASELTERQKTAVQLFCKQQLVQYERVMEDGRPKMVMSKVFASSNVGNTWYRFHINMKAEFFKTMAFYQIPRSEMEIVIHTAEIDDRFRVTFDVKKLWPPRDPQPAIIDHICSPGSNKVVTLQTGKGKTEITKHCMNNQGLRTAAFMRGGYIDRWVPDIEGSFHIKRGELLVVQGSKSLSAIMEMALEKEPIGHVNLISLNTFSDYLKDFEANGVTDKFPIAPADFFIRLGIGFGVLDEGHQFPHQVMKFFSHMNIHKFLSLSATLDTKDRFLNGMYEIMYPRPDRFNAGYYHAFIRVLSVHYQLLKPKSIKHRGFGGAYSHNAFEASLLTRQNKNALANYLKIIEWRVKERFIKAYQPGQKCIVFCGTINFCTLLQKYLQKIWPDKKVVRYVSKDKMSVMDGADIIVSTVLSAGTAVDIPNLIYNLMTTAIDSQQSNEQTLGRTRIPKDFPGLDPYFEYFVCDNIEAHGRYDNNKRAYFPGKVLSHGREYSPFSV